MGSQSDWPTMKCAAEVLDELGVAYEARIVSAHRTPDRMYAFGKGAARRRLPGHHRRRGRRGAPAGHARGADPSAGARRAGAVEGAVGHGQPALDRADARRVSRSARWRSARRARPMPACSPPRSWRSATRRWRSGCRTGAPRAARRSAEGPRRLMIAAPAAPSASSAAASSAGCWPWPRPSWAIAATSSRPTRDSVRGRSLRRVHLAPTGTTARRSPRSPQECDVVTYEFENVPVGAARRDPGRQAAPVGRARWKSRRTG